jgi:hypothetical protein
MILSVILGVSVGFAVSLAAAGAAVVMADVSVAAGSGDERLMGRSEEDASDAGAAGISAAADVDEMSMSRVLMGVPSFVVDELETTGVTKTFKIRAIHAGRTRIGGVSTTASR